MSSYWMKQTLIVSVLTVLMILPASAQQRRPQGPAKPAGGIPGKLEVPQKLGPAFKNAIEAQKAVIKAQIAALQALKKLNLEVKAYNGQQGDEKAMVRGGGGGGGRNTLSPDAKAKKGSPYTKPEPNTGLSGMTEEHFLATAKGIQDEYLRVMSLVLSVCADEGMAANMVQAKIESQVGKFDAAIGLLNTQLTQPHYYQYPGASTSGQ